MAVPWLLEERAAAAEIACVYLTDGGGHGVDPAVRDAESRAVLRTLGIGDDAVVMLAASNGRIGDGQLALRSLEALIAVKAWIHRSGFVPQRIYAPSYEGGHPDHDAAHLLAAVVASECGIAGDAWHFSLYNAYRRPRPFFATMRQLPSTSSSRRAAMTPRHAGARRGYAATTARSGARGWGFCRAPPTRDSSRGGNASCASTWAISTAARTRANSFTSGCSRRVSPSSKSRRALCARV